MTIVNVGTIGHCDHPSLRMGKSVVEEYLTKLMIEHWPKPIEISEIWIDECASFEVQSKSVVCNKPKPYWRQGERW